MSKIEKLAEAAAPLTEDQLDGVIRYVQLLTGAPVLDTAPAHVHASVSRGLAQRAAGETVLASDAFARLQAKIDTARW